MTKPFAPSSFRSHRSGLWLSALALVLAAPGCYHATGVQRSTPAAEEIPSTGGDRVPGLKSAAGPGDYFLGNDVVSLAVDGVPYSRVISGTGVPIAGALAGGSIVDAGYIELSSSYKRTSMPSDMLERLTPVVNQDPRCQMVFDSFEVTNGDSTASLLMTGGVVDQTGTLGAADANGRLTGVSVTHKISLGETDHFFLLETTVTNNSGAAVAIRSIGDYLVQKGGGYRLNVPAYADNTGAALSTWGVEVPGTTTTALGNFDIASSVRTPMVGLMGVEPAASTYDAHTSLGFLPVDEDYLLVACDDRQSNLAETRPSFPGTVVVGKPASASDPALASGASLTYRRRLYAEGGSSLVGAAGTKTYAYSYPNQATGIFNRMIQDRSTLKGTDAGWLAFQTTGSAVRFGGAPTEIRIEQTDGSYLRTEWLEPQEVISSSLSTNPRFWLFMPTGTYKITLRNQQPDQWSNPYVLTPFSYSFETFYKGNDEDHPDVPIALVVKDDAYDGDRTKTSKVNDFVIGDTILCPEYGAIKDNAGNTSDTAFPSVLFYAIEANAPAGHLQPLRFTFQGLTVPDPNLKRTRSLGSTYSTASKAKAITGDNFGCYAFGEGNQAFGTGFKSGAPFVASLIKGDYKVYATRGPLSLLQYRDFTVSTTSSNAYTFIIFPETLPEGWTSFDMPGPSMASTGGLLPGEKLSGALAEGVQVVANIEEDLLTESTVLRDEFRKEFDDPDATSRVTDEQRTAVGLDPFVVPGRSSDLSTNGYGVVTTLFTPDPTTARNRGARLPNNWTLADFVTQAEGSYRIVNRPRGPKGLFTLQTPSARPSNTLVTDVDAIELISAQALSDLGSATAWFEEFKTLRQDWFGLLNTQTPSGFTKALGLSSSKFTKDTPVGLARTYLKTAPYSATTTGIRSGITPPYTSANPSGFTQDNLTPILTVLQSGAAVASTGPFVTATATGTSTGSLGDLVTSSGSISLKVTVIAGDWVPVDEVRLVVNGAVSETCAFGASPADNGWTVDSSDSRKWTQTFPITVSRDSWVVLEAGVPLATTGTYAPTAYPAWTKIMKGIYPVAVTNPLFVDFGANGYTAPGNDD
ncbi:MAG: hypothetical protein H6Q00_2751 [Holophagaceae bacterium]|nr:hypothetical protein [Holophagaceae bacterium]